MINSTFDKVKVSCPEKETEALADVLSKTDKMMKVAFVGTKISLTLTRSDTKKPYVGTLHNMEFISTGQKA